MFSAYVVVTLLAIAANTLAATLDFVRYKQVLNNTARVGVPESWLTMLGILKATGALGLLLGLIGLPRTSCWPWPHWCWIWPREPSRVRWRLQSLRGMKS